MRPSIIIIGYNGCSYLPDCLSSVSSECQAYPGSEVILVDNASTDGSPDWVATHYPEIILVRNTSNLGFAAANNQGAAVASGDVLVFLNQDTRVMAGWLKALVNDLCQNDKVGMTTSKLLLMSQPDRINLCGQDIHYSGLVFGRGTLCAADGFNERGEIGAVSGASFAICKDVWEQLGGLDEAFFMYYEETDLSWRASLQGYSSWYVPDSIAFHDARLKSSPGVVYYSVRNRAILVLKHWKWLTLLLLLPAFLLTELVEWSYVWRLGGHYAAAKLRAGAWLLGHPRQILKARQEAQAGRSVSDALLLRQCVAGISPKVLSFGAFGRGWIKMANLLYALNYRVTLRLAEWLKI